MPQRHTPGDASTVVGEFVRDAVNTDRPTVDHSPPAGRWLLSATCGESGVCVARGNASDVSGDRKPRQLPGGQVLTNFPLCDWV